MGLLRTEILLSKTVLAIFKTAVSSQDYEDQFVIVPASTIRQEKEIRGKTHFCR